MAQIDVTVNGRSYSIACDDGQEDHLRDLAAYVDKRVQELVASLGQVGDLKLLVMASLLIADELSEAFAAIEQQATAETAVDDTALAEMVENIADRIERVAAKLGAP
jgi:cell division protein ZapA